MGAGRRSAPEAGAAGGRAARAPGRGPGRDPTLLSGAGFLSFHPDSPSALPADSVLLGDHVTQAAFDPSLGAGRGRGRGAGGGVRYGTQEGRERLPGVPEVVTPRKQSPGETNKLFRVKEGTALEGQRGFGENHGNKDPRPPRLPRPWESPGQARGPPGSATTGLSTALQGSPPPPRPLLA